MVSLTSWAESDIGRKRANNEDSLYHDQALGLFMIADGMGGHKGGDKASKIAIEEAAQMFKSQRGLGFSAEQALLDALRKAALEVHQESIRDSNLKGMGTTLSVLVVSEGRAFFGHIGDTRIYLMRDGMLKQLTQDHSLVGEQVLAGIMTEEEARVSSLRNIITRAIGHDENVEADYFSMPINKKDIFLLCTDGLNNMLLDSEIAEIICNLKPAKAIKELVAEANRKGGDDNISAILVEVR